MLIIVNKPNNVREGVFAMLLRNCAGGLIFWEDKVFLLRNDKDEWIFPKGVIRKGSLPHETALQRVREETGITADIISTAGQTSYEFFSVTRQKPVCNKITWYVMKPQAGEFNINREEGFKEGAYFSINKAMQTLTHSQDKALLNLSYRKFRDLVGVSQKAV